MNFVNVFTDEFDCGFKYQQLSQPSQETVHNRGRYQQKTVRPDAGFGDSDRKTGGRAGADEDGAGDKDAGEIRRRRRGGGEGGQED